MGRLRQPWSGLFIRKDPVSNYDLVIYIRTRYDCDCVTPSSGLSS